MIPATPMKIQFTGWLKNAAALPRFQTEGSARPIAMVR